MALFDKLFGEFIDVIDWTDDSGDTLVWRFERHGNEIKMGAQLTVRETQTAVFVNEGQLADVFDPGRYRLETENMPILTTLKGWKYGFKSPFKAEVYFVSRRRFTDLKWGTKNPIMLRDKEFGPVRLRAFGTYVIRVADPVAFIKEIAGTDGHFRTGEITDQLRNITVSRFSDLVAESGIPVLDLAANYDELGQFITERIAPEFAGYGLELTKLLVENISLPTAVEEALDKRTSMGVIGDLRKYREFQTAEAMTKAAENPGGDAGAGIGMGLGFAMANQMAERSMGGTDQPAATPPPLPSQTPFFVALDGKQEGPFAPHALAGLVADGRLTRDTLVWSQGMAGWQKAGAVDALSDLFAAVPPPLPPTG